MSGFVKAISRFQKKRFWRLGLMTHDVIRHDNPVYREAVALLPPDILEARQMRISKAFQYDGAARLAPESEWMTEEKDVPYLDPYIAYVEKRKIQEEEGKEKIESYRLTPTLVKLPE